MSRTVDPAVARENGQKLRYLYDSYMRHASAPNSQNILNFNLFGESAHLPDILHCETIAARSALHDWELAPHRHDRLHQLLLLAAGRAQCRLMAGRRRSPACRWSTSRPETCTRLPFSGD